MPHETTIHTGQPNYLAAQLRQILRHLDARHPELEDSLARAELLTLVQRIERLGDQPEDEPRQVDGLEPEQELRAEALHAACRLFADGDANGMRTQLADIIATANRFATWVRTGQWSA